MTSGYSKVVVDRRKFGGLVAVWDRRNRAASTLSDRQETTDQMHFKEKINSSVFYLVRGLEKATVKSVC